MVGPPIRVHTQHTLSNPRLNSKKMFYTVLNNRTLNTLVACMYRARVSVRARKIDVKINSPAERYATRKSVRRVCHLFPS